MMQKAKTVGKAASTFNPGTLRRRVTSRNNSPVLQSSEEDDEDDADDESTLPPLPDDSDLETESDVDSWRYGDGRTTKSPAAIGGFSSEEEEVETNRPLSRESTRHMTTDIRKKIPLSYQRSATQLYKLLAEKGRGKYVNWTRTGELVVKGQLVPNSNIVELLTDAARKKSTVKTPVGRAVFVNVVKKLNPALKHVKNKAVFSGSTRTPRRKKTSPVKRSGQQVGSGKREKIIWRTTL